MGVELGNEKKAKRCLNTSRIRRIVKSGWNEGGGRQEQLPHCRAIKVVPWLRLLHLPQGPQPSSQLAADNGNNYSDKFFLFLQLFPAFSLLLFISCLLAAVKRFHWARARAGAGAAASLLLFIMFFCLLFKKGNQWRPTWYGEFVYGTINHMLPQRHHKSIIYRFLMSSLGYLFILQSVLRPSWAAYHALASRITWVTGVEGHWVRDCPACATISKSLCCPALSPSLSISLYSPFHWIKRA